MANVGSYTITAVNAPDSSVHVTFTLSDGTELVDRQQIIHTPYLTEPDQLHAQLSDYLVAFERGIMIERAAEATKVPHPDLLALVGQSRAVEL